MGSRTGPTSPTNRTKSDLSDLPEELLPFLFIGLDEG